MAAAASTRRLSQTKSTDRARGLVLARRNAAADVAGRVHARDRGPVRESAAVATNARDRVHIPGADATLVDHRDPARAPDPGQNETDRRTGAVLTRVRAVSGAVRVHDHVIAGARARSVIDPRRETEGDPTQARVVVVVVARKHRDLPPARPVHLAALPSLARASHRATKYANKKKNCMLKKLILKYLKIHLG
jgi:hypothetical protein